MKSRTWLFNKGICKNLLRRCWPLYLAYLIALIVAYPLMVGDSMRWAHSGTVNLDRIVLEAGLIMVYLSVAFGALAAMVMFSYLYSAKGSGMMSALPIRRECLFITAYLTGLVPLLIADVLVVMLTYVFTAISGFFTVDAYLESFGALVLSNIAFYSFGVFCAMLTGSIIIMPIVYLVLNVAVFVAESCVRTLMSLFVYGMGFTGLKLQILSPLTTIINNVMVSRAELLSPYHINGMNYLLIYCFAGLALSAAAMLIYRRRHMEVATDVVAVPILKPVFKYCMAGGCAVVFAVFIYNNFFDDLLRAMPKAVFLLVLSLLGAFIGYFIAEMLMQKTVRVFKGKWKGYFICCAVLTAFIFSCELDAFGFERKLPELDAVESVYISRGNAELSEPENIKTALDLHRSIIGNKKLNEAADNKFYVSMNYAMKDGGTMYREYYLAGDEKQLKDPESDLLRMQALSNSQEAIDERCAMDIPLNKYTVTDFFIYAYWYDENGEYQESYKYFGAEDAENFYEDYLRHDIAAGTMGRNWWVENDEYFDTVSNVRFEIALSNRSLLPVGSDKNDIKHDYFTFRVNMDAEKCLEWIEENSSIQPVSLRDAEATLDR